MFLVRLTFGWILLLSASLCLGRTLILPVRESAEAYVPLAISLAAAIFLGTSLVAHASRSALHHYWHAERLQTQITQICLAAEGCTAPNQVVDPSRKDWSCTYDKVLRLRQDYDRLRMADEAANGLNSLSGTRVKPATPKQPVPGVIG